MKYKDNMKKPAHYYATMASMAELEGTNTENRSMIAGIFETLNRRLSSLWVSCCFCSP